MERLWTASVTLAHSRGGIPSRGVISAKVTMRTGTPPLQAAFSWAVLLRMDPRAAGSARAGCRGAESPSDEQSPQPPCLALRSEVTERTQPFQSTWSKARLCKSAVLTQEQMGIHLLELSSHARNERGLHTSEEQNKTAKANFKGETWSLIGKTKAWGHQWHWNCFRRLRCLLQCSASRQDHQHFTIRTSDLSSDPATQSVTDNVSYWPLSGTVIACSCWYFHMYTQRCFLTTHMKVVSMYL